jgi:hypothetical protein
MNTTDIIENIEQERFREIITKDNSRITVSPHALDHLSASQRRIFKEEDLIQPVLTEKPEGVGLQRNGRYSAFYKRKWGYLKIIIHVTEQKIEIITFINVEKMPNLKRMKNEL